MDPASETKKNTPGRFTAETCTYLCTFTEHHGASSPHSINRIEG